MLEEEYMSICPACGSVIDYCQGHGYHGDKYGAVVLRAHDWDIHTGCHEASDCLA